MNANSTSADPRRPALRISFALVAACLLLVFAHGAVAEPLPSWNDRPAKQAIMKFVTDVTTEGASTFVAPSERVAVFDNDGTLWSEQPLYFFSFNPAARRVQKTQEANGASIVVKDLVKTTKSWDSQLLLAYPQGQPEITIRRISIPAGARLHIHSHSVINAGVLITGQLRL
jgi:hypothetical protein